MSEFENEVISILKSINGRMTNMETDISGLKQDVSGLKQDVSILKQDVSEMKEEMEITRAATNYNGERLDELIEELKNLNVIS